MRRIFDHSLSYSGRSTTKATPAKLNASDDRSDSSSSHGGSCTPRTRGGSAEFFPYDTRLPEPWQPVPCVDIDVEHQRFVGLACRADLYEGNTCRPETPERKPDHDLHHCNGIAALHLACQRGSPCLREGAAGVDRQDHACDVTRFVGGQEQYCVRDFDRVNPGDR
jgi:hypothetical protein